MLRWGAQAAVSSKSSINDLKKGKIDIGVKASGNFSLAEAAVKFDSYLPYESGDALSLTYYDANKELMTFSFGRFRVHGSLVMSCFAGLMGEASAEVKINSEEQPAGHSMLMASSVNMGERNGCVGVKAQGFAGVQVGGQLTGSLEWLHPDKPQTEEVSGFAALAEVSANGNVAFGAGAGVDFQLALDRNNLTFYCNARLVWGPGGSGGFGTTVHFDQLWVLAKVMWQGLQHVDYRILENINEEMYKYLTHATYVAFATTQVITNPVNALQQAIISGASKIDNYIKERDARQKEAETLAERILNDEVYSEITLDKLTPEAIGMMLDSLVEAFVFSFEEAQEDAICKLLSKGVNSWRKFEEVLAHMTPNGQKLDGHLGLFKSLERINAILDDPQQATFNRWVNKLATKADKRVLESLAYEPYQGRQLMAKHNRVQQQYVRINPRSGRGYV